MNIANKDLFRIKYYDGSTSSGDYVVDTLHVAGANVTLQAMGLSRNATLANGIMGLGYHTATGLHRDTGETYDNVPLRMWRQGLIETVAFSIWMGSICEYYTLSDPSRLGPLPDCIANTGPFRQQHGQSPFRRHRR